MSSLREQVGRYINKDIRVKDFAFKKRHAGLTEMTLTNMIIFEFFFSWEILIEDDQFRGGGGGCGWLEIADF